MGKGRLIIVAAPSGTGKTTVIQRFLKSRPDTIHSVSCTTRPIRRGEVDGRDYHFVDRKIFEEWIRGRRLAEWAQVHGHLYGTPIEPLKKWLDEGREILLDLDVVGSLRLKKMYKDQAVAIFLIPPSMDELKRRLSSRKTDSAGEQEVRLKNAIEEMAHKDEFDHRVINDDLDEACREIEDILTR